MKAFLLLLVGTSFLMTSASAQYIWIDLSYKIVLNPADGSRPPDVTDSAIDQAIADANQLLDSYSRGYRLRRVDPIREVGGMGDTDASHWYSVNFFDKAQVNGRTQGSIWKDEMEGSAILNSQLYAWNFNAINLYITAGICGGVCSFHGESDNIIIIGGCSAGNGRLQLHEIGHYFGLYHTQGSPCGNCGSAPGECNTPGDDEIADTLPDLPCWDQNQIALNWTMGDPAGARDYGQLSPGEQFTVDNTFSNLMSYHNNAPTRLTELQLDRWAFSAYSARRRVASGRTWFVAVGGHPLQDGTPFRPLGSVISATIEASQGDIVMLRPGNYDEIGEIRSPVTLRATRTGPAIIGGP